MIVDRPSHASDHMILWFLSPWTSWTSNKFNWAFKLQASSCRLAQSFYCLTFLSLILAAHSTLTLLILVVTRYDSVKNVFLVLSLCSSLLSFLMHNDLFSKKGLGALANDKGNQKGCHHRTTVTQ